MRLLLLIATSLLWTVLSFAQNKPSAPPFTKLLVGTDCLYALDAQGQFHVWDLSTHQKIHQSKDSTIRYTALAKDRSNTVYLGTKGKIYSLNKEDYTLQEYLTLKKAYPIRELFFNSKNEPFLIVPYAVYDPVRDRFWNKFKQQPNGVVVKKPFLFFFKKRTRTYFEMPQYSFMDSQDRIWMVRNYGEFGGSLQIFDAQNRKVVSSDIDQLNFGLFFPRSVFEDQNQQIYITSGLQHFTKSGEIYHIDDRVAHQVYNSKDHRDTTKATSLENGIFVGPGAYNPQDQKIYFATTEGFYRLPTAQGNTEQVAELVFQPELIWDREPLAIGAAMSVKKLAFTPDHQLIFLTANNGIGIYDGQALNMIQ